MINRISFFIIALLCCTLISCSNEGSDETRAGIIAEDFVKQDVLSSEDLEFDLVGVDKENADEYHVVANIKTLNGMGFKVPRKVSVRLRYNGSGDWTESYNWSLISVSYLDEATGETQGTVANNEDAVDGWDAFNDAKEGDMKTIGGVKFSVITKNDYSESLASEKKLSPLEVKTVCKALKGKDVYFYINGATESLADCYAHMIGGTIEYEEQTIK